MELFFFFTTKKVFILTRIDTSQFHTKHFALYGDSI